MLGARDCLKSIARIGLTSDRIFRALCGKQLAVFMFHDVSENPSKFSEVYNLNVAPNVFDSQLKLIKKYFRVIDPREVNDILDINEPLALITFDDGLPGYFENAIPILNANDCPSIIFLNMEPVLGGTFWSGLVTYVCNFDSEFRSWVAAEHPDQKSVDFLMVSRDLVNQYLASRSDPSAYLKIVADFHGGFADIRMLEYAARCRGVYFGSHLFNHYNAANISESELTEAFQMNEVALRHYEKSLPLFSYPFGQPNSCFNARTHKLLLTLGASRLFDSVPLFNRRADSKLLHRINMTNDVVDEVAFKERVMLPSWRVAISNSVSSSYMTGRASGL